MTDGNGKLLVKPFPPTAYVWMEKDAQVGGLRIHKPASHCACAAARSFGSQCSGPAGLGLRITTCYTAPSSPALLYMRSPLPVPPLHCELLQTKRQIEKAVDLLRKNGVRADSIYVRSSRAC